jgi:hypothetical protein
MELGFDGPMRPDGRQRLDGGHIARQHVELAAGRDFGCAHRSVRCDNRSGIRAAIRASSRAGLRRRACWACPGRFLLAFGGKKHRSHLFERASLPRKAPKYLAFQPFGRFKPHRHLPWRQRLKPWRIEGYARGLIIYCACSPAGRGRACNLSLRLARRRSAVSEHFSGMRRALANAAAALCQLRGSPRRIARLRRLRRQVVVRAAGIEPALPKKRVFETRASTCSATPA